MPDLQQFFGYDVVFEAIDWTWLVLFILLMTVCGVLFYRLGKRSQADFFLAGRGLPWWLPASSVYATHTATDTPIWIGGVIYEHGLRGIWITFFSAWCAISSLVSTRIFRRSLAYSQAEWQGLRFSGLGAELLRGWLAGWQIFMNMFILGWVGIAMGKVCHLAFAWPEWIGLVLFSSICAVYVLTAGYWGVVMADFQQGVIAFVAILVISAWGIMAAGGPGMIVERLQSMDELWRLNPFAFTGLVEGDFPFAWFFTLIFMALLAGFGMGTYIDWYAEAQRIQSAKTVRDASYSIWSGTALVLLRNGIWAVAILGFFIIFPNISGGVKQLLENPATPIEQVQQTIRLDPGSPAAGAAPVAPAAAVSDAQVSTTAKGVYEVGWFVLSFKFLPAGLLGFFFAAIVAIHFSTISTHLNLGAMYITRDIFHHYLHPKASEKQLVWVGRLATLVLLLGSFVYGLMMESITSWLIFAIWIMTAGIWLPSILQVVWWRFNSWGYLSAWMANLGLSWLIVWILPSFGVLAELRDYHQFWILMVVGIFIYLPATFFTKTEDMDKLVRFYVMSRPIGWWGPVRREAERRGLITPKGGLAPATETL